MPATLPSLAALAAPLADLLCVALAVGFFALAAGCLWFCRHIR